MYSSTPKDISFVPQQKTAFYNKACPELVERVPYWYGTIRKNITFCWTNNTLWYRDDCFHPLLSRCEPFTETLEWFDERSFQTLNNTNETAFANLVNSNSSYLFYFLYSNSCFVFKITNRISLYQSSEFCFRCHNFFLKKNSL